MEYFKVGDLVFYDDWLGKREEGIIDSIDSDIMSIRLDAKVSTTARFIDGKWQAFRIGEEDGIVCEFFRQDRLQIYLCFLNSTSISC